MTGSALHVGMQEAARYVTVVADPFRFRTNVSLSVVVVVVDIRSGKLSFLLGKSDFVTVKVVAAPALKGVVDPFAYGESVFKSVVVDVFPGSCTTVPFSGTSDFVTVNVDIARGIVIVMDPFAM